MANGEVCCILGVCCPAGSQAQRAALVTMIKKAHPKMATEQVDTAADRILDEHDCFRGVERILKSAAV